MQLPPADEIVMVAGTPPIRAKKARYKDRRFKDRLMAPPVLARPAQPGTDDWSPAAASGQAGEHRVIS